MAAAAAAAAAAVSSSGETFSACKAFGACWSVEGAYASIRAAGCTTAPVHVVSKGDVAPGDLTVLGARAAIENNCESAIAVQKSRKRTSGGDSAKTLVGWVVL